MRWFIFILMGLLTGSILIGFFGCSDNPTEPEPPPPPPTLVGTWEWILTSGPDTYLTPYNQGYDLTLIFADDSTYVEYKDASPINHGTYSIGDSVFWMDEWMQVLTLEGYLLQKAFTFHTNDSLIMADYIQANTLVYRYLNAD